MATRELIIRADWDEEARVWVATSQDLPGLSIEADTIEALRDKLSGAVRDLLELNGLSPEDGRAPRVELVAHAQVPVAA